MKIVFHLGWVDSGGTRRLFKMAPAADLFSEYLKRTAAFIPCETAPAYDFSKPKAPGDTIWVCDFHPRSKMLKSEELAEKINTVSQSTRTLHVVIGGADGFPEIDRKNMKADLIWSFGPMTLPHELAAVVAAEQIYRAWTILRNQPYHAGHVI